MVRHRQSGMAPESLVLLDAPQPVDALQGTGRHGRKHWNGILAFFPSRITSAAIESITGIL